MRTNAALSRRRFLGASLGALGAPWVAGAGAQDGPRDIRDLPPADSLTPGVVPEYERSLSHVLLMYPSGPTARAWAERKKDSGVSDLFVASAFRDLLDAFPAYTDIRIVARREQSDAALALLPFAGERSVAYHLVTDPSVEVEIWAQDLGERVRFNGRRRFLVSKRMPDAMGLPGKMSQDRRRVAQFLFGPESVVEAPFVFEGGNLAYDVVDDRLRVFVGRNAIQRTIDAIAAEGRATTRSVVLESIRSTFGAAEVIEVGRRPQQLLLQHIDQSFLILGGGIAVVPRASDDVGREERVQLEDHASQLRELGYELIGIDHTAEDLLRWRSSVNGVPFTDRSTGQRRILFPVFPGEAESSGKRPTRNELIGKAAQAFDVYRDAGYEPIPVRDVTHVLGGNTHCILNVLS